MTQRLPGERRAAATATPPEAIAPVVAFLASDRASHITGQVIGVRGDEVTVFSHPAPLRTATRAHGWAPPALGGGWEGAPRLGRLAARRSSCPLTTPCPRANRGGARRGRAWHPAAAPSWRAVVAVA